MSFDRWVAMASVLVAMVAAWAAWRQSSDANRWRSQDLLERARRDEESRSEIDRREREARLLHDRIARRDLYRSEYDDIRQVLNSAQNVAYQVHNHGPLTMGAFNVLGLGTSGMDAEQLMERVPDSLRAPLLAVAEAVDELLSQAIVDESTVIGVWEDTIRVGGELQNLDWRLRPYPAQRQAVRQHLAALELDQRVAAAREALLAEFGG